MPRAISRVGYVSALIVVGVLVAGCSAAGAPTVTTDPPKASAVPETTPTTVEAEAGTRQNPLAVGEHRKITTDSMWTVGAEGPSQVNDGYTVLPIRVGFDWDAYQKQIDQAAQGGSVDDGADPFQSLLIEYITAGGRSYKTMDNYNVTIENDLFKIGTVYPPAEQISANYAVSVPNEEIPGGMWVVKNFNGDGVFIASE